MRIQARRYALLQGAPLEMTIPGLQEAGGWTALLGRDAPLYLEIGLGKDPHLIERAVANPEGTYVGLEYSRKKLDKVLSKALRRGVKNLRVLHADAVRVLDPLLAEESLSGVYMLFPDPWPKKRHRKKRLIQPEFSCRLVNKLLPGADLELRTDNVDYRDQMLEVLHGIPDLENRLGQEGFAREPHPPEDHIATLFERKYRERGLSIYYLYFRKKGARKEQ